jgi:sigma-B regulation protein RsbU (phosphoserine phosphatase)
MVHGIHQLETIGALQRRLLPRQIPQPPGWTLSVHYEVGPWPGGDYYDVLPLADGRLLLIVGDASDEGGPSSVLVALVRAALHSCPLSSGQEKLPFCPFREPVLQPPHIILGHLNRVLAENSLDEQYMTAFCALLSPEEGTFHYANAGHPAPRWHHAATGHIEPLRDPLGMPLGLGHNAIYHQRRLDIEPGDLLVFYSDGLTAAVNNQGTILGTDRLDRVISAGASGGAEAVRNQIVSELRQFLAGAKVQDDVTVLVVGRQAE